MRVTEMRAMESSLWNFKTLPELKCAKYFKNNLPTTFFSVVA